MEQRAPPPTWINQEFVEKVLEKKRHKKFTIDAMDVKYACVEGTGYASLMFRVVTDLKEEGTEEISKDYLLVKVALDSGKLKEMMDKCHGFKTESLILHEVMPQIHASLASVENEKFRRLTAECYHWGQEPKEFLVLQDLSAAGFRMAEGGKPLDYPHCRLVMQAYGRLHAASVKILKEQPHYKTVFTHSLYRDKDSIQFFRTIGEKIFFAVADELAKTPGYEQYSEKYRALIDGYVDDALELFESRKNETKLPVLVHGDCWKNNMMFKYMDDEVTDIRLVDLQMANVTNLASDLQYFLFSNASEEVHRHHVDSLLQEYHGTLQTTLRRLGLEVEAESYTFEELQLDMDRCAALGLMFSAFSGVVLTSEKYGAEFTQAFNDPEKSDDAMKKMLQNPYTLPCLKYLIPIFDSKGLFTLHLL